MIPVDRIMAETGMNRNVGAPFRRAGNVYRLWSGSKMMRKFG